MLACIVVESHQCWGINPSEQFSAALHHRQVGGVESQLENSISHTAKIFLLEDLRSHQQIEHILPCSPPACMRLSWKDPHTRTACPPHRHLKTDRILPIPFAIDPQHFH